MPPRELTMPKLSDSMADAVILRWLKAAGDAFARIEPGLDLRDGADGHDASARNRHRLPLERDVGRRNRHEPAGRDQQIRGLHRARANAREKRGPKYIGAR